MEHRYDKRFPCDLKTLIFKNGMPVALGRLRNYSRGGIFVSTEFNLVDAHQSLEIELVARSDARSSAACGERRVCKAFVMHKAGEGIGLLIREDCMETQSNFAAFIADELSRYQAATKAAVVASSLSRNSSLKNIFLN